jgi:phage terminase small subunit
MSKMTTQQRLFCNEYMKDHNATEAAVRAGYSPKTARSQGARLLTNVQLQPLLVELMESTVAEIGYDAQCLLQDMLDVLKVSKRRAIKKGSGAQDIQAFKGMVDTVGKHIEVQAFKESIGIEVDSALIDKLNAAQARAIKAAAQ